MDQQLFDALRDLRRETAESEGLQPYMVFSDATLRELAKIRPSSLASMRLIYGIGEVKLEEYGEEFLEVILEHCRERGLTIDERPRRRDRSREELPAFEPPAPKRALQPNAQRELAFRLFAQSADLQDVIHQTKRSPSTAVEYLCQYIADHRPASVSQWVSDEVVEQVAAALEKHGDAALKPLFVELGEKVPYEEIRIAVAYLAVRK